VALAEVEEVENVSGSATSACWQPAATRDNELAGGSERWKVGSADGRIRGLRLLISKLQRVELMFMATGCDGSKLGAESSSFYLQLTFPLFHFFHFFHLGRYCPSGIT
jgi:hypothetical protein